MFLLSLWWICFDFEAYQSSVVHHLYGEILWLHDVGLQYSFQMQMAHLESRTLKCLIDLEIMKK